MSIGLAIFFVVIIGFAICSSSFRRLLLFLLSGVLAALIALFVHQQNINKEEWESLRIEAQKKHTEQTILSVCLNLNTQSQCVEEIEATCHSNTDVGSEKECIATAARWCPDEGTRKRCIVDTLRARDDARRAAQARREEQEQHDAWRPTVEQEAPEAMQRSNIRGE